METLQYVLLPRLSAVDLFRLACTSKAMQHWLLSTSPHLWLVRSSRISLPTAPAHVACSAHCWM